MRFYGIALKALVFTILLYIGWSVVIGIGVAIVALSLPDISVLTLIGALVAVFGAAMALLSLAAVLIKISVGVAIGHQTRRLDSEIRRAEQASRESGRAQTPISRNAPADDKPISERPSSFEEAMRRRNAGN